jgi:heterodisulfide reductase subunit A-like polyferredoxin
VKNALKIKELSPETDVIVLYRELRTYGFREKYYTRARQQGVRFVRYDLDNKPQVSAGGERLRVDVRDPILARPLQIDCDLLALAPAIVPRDDAEDVAQMLKVPLSKEKFFLEAHMKLRPVDFSVDGVYVAGLAHSPKDVGETIAQAGAAASRAATVISKSEYVAEPTVAHVDEEVCSGCGVCTHVCPYEAPQLVVKNGRLVCEVNRALCKGCGSCASLCPSGAMQQQGFNAEQLGAMVQACLR